jgi:hypothetical protein
MHRSEAIGRLIRFSMFLTQLHPIEKAKQTTTTHSHLIRFSMPLTHKLYPIQKAKQTTTKHRHRSIPIPNVWCLVGPSGSGCL